MLLNEMRIGVIVTGGIAAYKATELVRQLVKAGAQVRVVMTESACEFITPLTLQVLSRHRVLLDTFDEFDPEHVQHIEFAQWCDAVIVAPATANFLAKLSQGLADDIALSCLLAVTSPVLLCPAMNNNMYNHPATKRNLKQLTADGYYVLEPETGFLAEGYEAKGRLPQISSIITCLESLLASKKFPQLLADQTVVVTAGGTVERIDPVRYISNDSSGKMGYALAKFAVWLGAKVHFICSKEGFPILKGMTYIKVESARKMQEAVESVFDQADYVVMAAAVSDFRVKESANEKIKKKDLEGDLKLTLVENPDILATLGRDKSSQIIIGFAAETQNLLENAYKKLEKKNADWIIANDVSGKETGFNSDLNQVVVLGRDGRIQHLAKADKLTLAGQIWSIVTDQGIDDE